METKIARLQRGWNIDPPLPCIWGISEEDLQVRLRYFENKLLAKQQENSALGTRQLHQIMFTILNGFVNYKYYDSKDRHLLKLFIETCSDIFQNILKVKHEVHMGFLLSYFEKAFATRTLRDRYDIKNMHKLFGQEILDLLQIESSI